MSLLFWVATILLCLAVVGGYVYPRVRDGVLVLVAIDLVLLGLHVFGVPR